MRLEIDYKKITDSPYKKDTDSFFKFTDEEVLSFVEVISKMNESSHYISGYRGVGKTSFIKKVEEELKKIDGFVFIHVSVSKFDSFGILIRNFIRQFYHQINHQIEELKQKELKKDKKLRKNEVVNESLLSDLSKLNRQTFSSIDTEYVYSRKFEKQKVKILSSLKDEIVFFLAVIFIYVLFNVDFGSNETYKLIAQVITGVVAIVQAVKMTSSYIKTYTANRENKETERSLYDDEIAEYRFNELLAKFKAAGIKTVFVIDELDKLTVKEAKKVLFLFKSTLLSGKANFIVVGGQDLYYEIYHSNSMEDSVLSTLFSKTFHVPLKSTYELKSLFEKLIKNKEIIKTDVERAAFDQYLSWLIIESKRVPRKFVNLIKGALVFEKGLAFIDIPEIFQKPAYTEQLNAIDITCEKMESHPEPIRDYIIMNIFMEGDNILAQKTMDNAKNYINSIK